MIRCYKNIYLCVFFATAAHTAAYGQTSFEVYAQNSFNKAVVSLIRLSESPEQAASFKLLQSQISASFNSVPTILKTIDARRALEFQSEEAKAALLPRATLAVGGGNKDQNLTSYQSDGNSNSVTASVSQLLYDFGTSASGYQSSKDKLRAGRFGIANQRSEVLLQLLTVTLEVQRTRQNLVFTQGYVDARRDFLKLVQEKEKLGAGSNLDIIRTRTKLAEALDEIPTADKRLKTAEASYKSLFGAPPVFKEQAYQLPQQSGSKTSKTINEYLTGLNAFREVESTVAALKNDYASGRGRLFGAFTFEASRTESRDRPLQKNTVEQAAVIYRVDIFSGFAQTARAKALAAKASEAEFERDRVRRELTRKLEVAYAEVDATQAAFAARLEFLKGAQATDIATRDLFFLNRGTLTDVFKAQEDVFSAAQKLISADYDRKVAFYSLLHLNDQLLELFDLNS